MKQILSIALAAIMTAAAFSGCTAKSPETAPKISITASGSSEKYASWLENRLTSDGIIPEENIVIGTAETADSYGVDLSVLKDEEGYIIRTVDGNTVIFAKTEDGIDRGVRYFANNYGSNMNVTYGEGYRVGSIAIEGTDLSEFVILNTAPADDSVTYAAEELRDYLGKACGVSPEIVTEGEYPHKITLQKDTAADSVLGDEAFTVTTDSTGLTITGGKYRGCLYGVYDLLERYVGYRFYYENMQVGEDRDSAAEYLYEAQHIEISDVSLEVHPSITWRDTYNGDKSMLSPKLHYNGEHYRSFTYYYTRPNVSESNLRLTKYGNFGTVLKACHGIASIIPSHELPDLGFNAGYDHGVNPCFTDEYLLETIEERVLRDIRNRTANGEVPGTDITNVDLGQYDIMYFCNCSSCMEVYSEEGAITGAFVRMANRISEALEREGYDGLYVQFFAYAGALAAPKAPGFTMPRDNVQVSFCFYIDDSTRTFICGNHALNDPECENNAVFAKEFDKWCEMCETVYVWYYPMCTYQYNSTPNLFMLYDNMKYMAESGTFGIFSLENLNHEGGFPFIHRYMTQRLMWNCDITFDEYIEMMKEFLTLVYGEAGAEAVYRYIEVAEAAADRRDCWTGFHHTPIGKMDYEYMENFLPELRELFENAIRTAETENREYMLQMMFSGVRITELFMYHTDMWVEGDADSRAEYKELVDSYITDYPNIHLFSDITTVYPPTLEEVDYDMNPYYWVSRDWEEEKQPDKDYPF